MMRLVRYSLALNLAAVFALNFSYTSAASSVEDLVQEIKRSSNHATGNFASQIHKKIYEDPSLYHDPLFIAKGYQEDQLISNWNKVMHLLTEASRFYPQYLEELKFQQARKQRKLRNLFSYTLPSNFPADLAERTEYVAFAQVCSFEMNEKVNVEQIAKKYSVSNSVLNKYKKNLQS
jgi:hypothetical protein